jgi:hypothetical protein
MMGAGGALFDHDGDGDLDLYLVQGAMLGPGKTVRDAFRPPQHPLPLTDRLYRNDLEIRPDGTRVLRFTDVSAASGLAAHGYGMGVATGDYDGDGDVDLYVANFGPNQLWRNRGDGTFEDVTAGSGSDDPRWSVSASFADFDRDGWLDLYVANYVAYSLANDKTCRGPDGRPDYCSPSSYEPEPDRLFRNRGDGTFEDVTVRSGIAAEYSSALSVVAADFDGDGWIDFYVANDGRPNSLWHNEQDGRFRNVALVAGAALNADGMAEASMGVEAADFDDDGDEDLFLTHLVRETNTAYLNDGKGWFQDVSATSGLGPASLPFTGFGTAVVDHDGDGWLDIVVVNGAVGFADGEDRDETRALAESNLLFRGLGGGRFEDVTRRAGPGFALVETSRGAMGGDVDNDGDADVVIAQNGGPVRLLLGTLDPPSRWLGLRLTGGASGRDALGARVALRLSDGRTLWRRAHADGSYGSARDPRVLASLPAGATLERVSVRWPGGRRESWPPPELGRYTTLVEGSGRRDPEGTP